MLDAKHIEKRIRFFPAAFVFFAAMFSVLSTPLASPKCIWRERDRHRCWSKTEILKSTTSSITHFTIIHHGGKNASFCIAATVMGTTVMVTGPASQAGL